MRELLGRYLGEGVPVKERLFNAATFLSSVFALLFVAVAILLRIDIISVSLYFSIGVLGTVLFFLNIKKSRVTLYSVIYLTYVNLFAFPVIMINSNKDLMEIPLYSIVGLVLAIALLDGKLRAFFFMIQMVVDLSMAYYCYVIKDPNAVHYVATTNSDFFRIEVAIVITGLLCGFIVHFRNYQLEKEIKAREDATLKAEKVSFAMDMFLVNVSHEIRTPLNAIIGTTELLMDSDANNRIKETTFNISNSSHALLSITTDLLDFSRMNIDSIVPEEEKYDVAFMLNDIVNLMSVRLLDSNVDFFVKINPNLPKTLIGDSGKIRQIIINMLSNAIKYTKEGHMTLYVDFTELERYSIKLKIKVEDTGIGIRAENLQKIFEPYNRSGEETDRLIEGNGLGLALCKKLAKAMGGDIVADSIYGEGSTFIFEVPQKADTMLKEGTVGYVKNEKTSLACFVDGIKEMEDLSSIFAGMKLNNIDVKSEDEFVECCIMDKCSYYLLDSTSYERIKDRLLDHDIDWKKIVVVSDCNYSYSSEPFEFVLTRPISCLNIADLVNHTKNYTIRKQRFEGGFSIPEATVLVVDDNLLNLEVAAGILERYHPKVLTASSGKECLICLQDEHVDIVFLDYMMPEMDGIDTLKEIRKLEGSLFKELPVVALTANVVSGAREMFLNEGFNGYLSKPLEIESLEKVLNDELPSRLIKYDLTR